MTYFKRIISEASNIITNADQLTVSLGVLAIFHVTIIFVRTKKAGSS